MHRSHRRPGSPAPERGRHPVVTCVLGRARAGAVTGALALTAGCTNDLDAPAAFLTTAPSSDSDSDSDTAADVGLVCGDFPLAAVAASYAHTPTASGGSGFYDWSATGLPTGMTIDPQSGAITGQPDTEGSFPVLVTITDRDGGASAQANCTITVNPKLDYGFDPGKTRPCLEIGENLGDFQLDPSGDGTAVTCSLAAVADNRSLGNGKVPEGITVNPTTCAIEGAVSGADAAAHGTFAWIVKAEQNGAAAYVPYCVTVDNPTTMAVAVAHSGVAGDRALVPGLGTFTPGVPPTYGSTAGDPLFTMTEPGKCQSGDPQPACFFAFLFGINASPFQANINLNPATRFMDNSGFTHELSATATEPVPADLEDRPWIANIQFAYCLEPNEADCDADDPSTFQNDPDATLEWAIVMVPARN
jgi:hypothetical protein